MTAILYLFSSGKPKLFQFPYFFSDDRQRKRVLKMGGADDRSTSYYGGPQGPRCGPPSSAGSAGQGGSSRDFHYVTGPDHHFRSGSSSSRQSRNSSSTGSSNYHSPHVVPSSAGKNNSNYNSDFRRLHT